MAKYELVAEPGKQETFITFRVEAPRELVFRAYTEPELIKEWWGPRKYFTEVNQWELEPGGRWRIIHRDSKTGEESAFHGNFQVVQAPAEITWTFEYEGMPGHISLETVEFEDEHGITKVVTHSVYQSVEDRDGMIKSGMEEGMSESIDRLEELIALLKAE